MKHNKAKSDKTRDAWTPTVRQEDPEGEDTLGYKTGSHAANWALELSFNFLEEDTAPTATWVASHTALSAGNNGEQGTAIPSPPPAAGQAWLYPGDV